MKEIDRFSHQVFVSVMLRCPDEGAAEGTREREEDREEKKITPKLIILGASWHKRKRENEEWKIEIAVGRSGLKVGSYCSDILALER